VINRSEYIDDYGLQIDPLFDIVDEKDKRIKDLEKELQKYRDVITAAQYSIHCMEQAGAFLNNALDQKMAKGLVDRLGGSLAKPEGESE